jgi:predicted amidohydrolase YtcJ
MVDFYVSSQSLSPYEALCCYTKNPARMLGEADDLGTLETGKLANFFSTREDLLKGGTEILSGMRAEQTWIAGRPAKRLRGNPGELIVLLLRRARKI